MIPNPVGTFAGADRGTHDMKKGKKRLKPAGRQIEDSPAPEPRQEAEGVLPWELVRSIDERLSLVEMNQMIQTERAHLDQARISRCEVVLGIHSRIENRYLSENQKEDDELPF